MFKKSIFVCFFLAILIHLNAEVYFDDILERIIGDGFVLLDEEYYLNDYHLTQEQSNTWSLLLIFDDLSPFANQQKLYLKDLQDYPIIVAKPFTTASRSHFWRLKDPGGSFNYQYFDPMQVPYLRNRQGFVVYLVDPDQKLFGVSSRILKKGDAFLDNFNFLNKSWVGEVRS